MPNETPPDIEELWMIVRMDVHGNNFLIAEGLGAAAAKSKLDALLAKTRWPHHQTYSLYDYARNTRTQLLGQLHLIL